jgi:hypothetical protein
MSGVNRPADLNLLQVVDPDYACTPDGRFYAFTNRRGEWHVKDEQGWYFTGDNGRVASLEAADSYVEAWAEQAGARAGETARWNGVAR